MPSNNLFCVVWMVTYNHENYIAKAIESVINQKTNFGYKLFIGDDHSADKTIAICESYAVKYPDKIELVVNDANIGSHNNGVKTYNRVFQSSAKYIAILDGDDYWCDENKLQKQVDFLEANPEYVLSFHKIKILEDGQLIEDNITKVPENYQSIDTLASLGNYIHTPSVVFRNVIKEFPEEFSKSSIGDYFLYMILAQHGKIMHLEDTMAVYRKNSGIWSSMNLFQRRYKTAIAHALLYKYFSRQRNKEITEIFFGRVTDFINDFSQNLSYKQIREIVNSAGNKKIYFSLFFKNIAKPKSLLKIILAAL